jgi:hypothetical protein
MNDINIHSSSPKFTSMFNIFEECFLGHFELGDNLRIFQYPSSLGFHIDKIDNSFSFPKK